MVGKGREAGKVVVSHLSLATGKSANDLLLKQEREQVLREPRTVPSPRTPERRAPAIRQGWVRPGHTHHREVCRGLKHTRVSCKDRIPR